VQASRNFFVSDKMAGKTNLTKDKMAGKLNSSKEEVLDDPNKQVT